MTERYPFQPSPWSENRGPLQTEEQREETIDEGVADKRLLVIEPEFANVLRQFERQGNSLSATLRQFWDTGDVRTLTKNSPARTTGSMVSVVGHITLDELRRYLTRTEAGNGLANRFLFATARRSKLLPFGGDRVILKEIGEELEIRISALRARRDKAMLWTDPARNLWSERYPALSEAGDGLFGAVTSRGEAQTLRLALTYALLDGRAFVDLEHLLAALEVWRYCEESARYIFGETTGDPVADEIHRMLIAAKPNGITRTDISNLFGRNRNASEIQRGLGTLLARGLTWNETRKPSKGRPVEVWHAA